MPLTAVGAGRQWVMGSVIHAHAAATATEEAAIYFNPTRSVQIYGVYVIPYADITGANTDTTHLNLIDSGADGSGTSEKGNIDFVSGTDGTASDAKTLYSDSSGFLLDAGDVLTVQIEKVGNGLLLPNFATVIDLEFRG